ncbi:MAG: cyclic nucleotide-binding domain-containing protein [Desulfobacterales bacterium]|nr:cyclic nucleotide-binding domain-containing protein [Desulfobacterales bacterium]
METKNILQSIPFFENLPDQDLKQLCKNARIVEYRSGDVIIQEGERGDRFFIMIEGEVTVYKGLGKKHKKQFKSFGSRTYFGEMSLIDKRNRSATVVAETYVKVLCIEREDFQNQIRRNPEMAFILLERMSLRVRAMNKLILGTLGEIAPICIRCNKVREPDNRWVSVEQYILDNSDIEVPHSLCPECSQRNYPKFYQEN